MSALLSPELLGRFDEALARAGALVVEAWLPGLSEDEIRTTFDEFDEILLPQELVTWWQWHGGVDRSRSAYGVIGASKEFREPANVALSYRQMRDLPPRGALTWISAQEPWLFIDCAGPATERASLLHQYKSESAWPMEGSLGDLVEHWIGFIESGVWTFDRTLPAHVECQLEDSRLPPEPHEYTGF